MKDKRSKRMRRIKRTWNKIRCWVILLALQAWIIPCILCEQEREVIYQLPEEIMETEEEIIRWKVEADTEEVMVEPLEVKTTPTTEPPLISLGVFRLTAYCNCSECCGIWAGKETDSGVMPCEGRTIAVDTSVIPFRTEVIINGHTYIAEDTGGKWIVGKQIDIYFDSHQEAKEFGIKYAEVFIRR